MSEIITEAFYIARNGRPGPVLIDIPKDVGLEEMIDYKPIQIKDLLKKRNYRFDKCIPVSILKKSLQLIKQSSQPLLYIGGGAIRSNCYKILRKFIDRLQIPVTTTLMGKGVFDESHNLSLGMLGMHGTAYANFAVSECDLLIAIGTRFDDRVTGKLDEFATHAQVIHIDIDPAEISKNRIPQVPIIGDVGIILKELLKENLTPYKIDTKQIISWRNRISRWKKIYPLNIPINQTSLSPQYVISLIGKTFPNSIVTTDVGQHQMWSAQFLNVLPYSWASSSGLGTMGFGLPAAIGAAFAKFENTPVVCISGDSSFQMCLQELGTIKQYNLPIKIFIINNQWQGMVRQWQQSFYGKRYSHSSMESGSPEFETLALSYGLMSFKVDSSKNLEYTLNKIKNDYMESSVLVNIMVQSEENCYPMVAPGKSNSQMIGITKVNPSKSIMEPSIPELQPKRIRKKK
jgi:acetolactate synthase-1/2/3 large subunit